MPDLNSRISLIQDAYKPLERYILSVGLVLDKYNDTSMSPDSPQYGDSQIFLGWNLLQGRTEIEAIVKSDAKSLRTLLDTFEAKIDNLLKRIPKNLYS